MANQSPNSPDILTEEACRRWEFSTLYSPLYTGYVAIEYTSNSFFRDNRSWFQLPEHRNDAEKTVAFS